MGKWHSQKQYQPPQNRFYPGILKIGLGHGGKKVISLYSALSSDLNKSEGTLAKAGDGADVPAGPSHITSLLRNSRSCLTRWAIF